MNVIPGMRFGALTTKWSWKNHNFRRIWKCICECGGYCYVKEDALINGIVTDCGKCEENIATYEPQCLINAMGYEAGQILVLPFLLLSVLNTNLLELKSYTNEIKYRSYQTVIPIQESWIDGNICNIPFDITTALMTDKPYIFYVLPCSVIGHQVRYDYDLSTSTVAIVSIEFGAQLIAGNNVRFGIFIAGI